MNIARLLLLRPARVARLAAGTHLAQRISYRGKEEDPEETYKSYLERKEYHLNNKKKALLEVPTLNSSSIVQLMVSYRLYHILDFDTFCKIEKEMANRLSTLDDDEFLGWVREACKTGFKFREFRFLENKLFRILSEASRDYLADHVADINAIVASNQLVSSEFAPKIIELYRKVFPLLEEESKLLLLRVAVFTNQARPDDIPRDWLKKLETVSTTKEFIISVDIVKRLYDSYMDLLVPEAYKEKVMEYAKQQSQGSISMHVKLMEILDVMGSGLLGEVTFALIDTLKTDIKSIQFGSFVKGCTAVLRTLKKHPKYFNMNSLRLLELTRELAVFIEEQKDAMSMEELVQTSLIFLDISDQTTVYEQESIRKVVLGLVECLNRGTIETNQNVFLGLLRLVVRCLQTDTIKRELLKDAGFQESLNSLFNGSTLHKYGELQLLEMLESLSLLTAILRDEQVFKPEECALLLQAPFSKLATVQLSNFESFVKAMSSLDAAIESTDEKSSRQLRLLREKVLSKYSPQSK